MTTEMPIVSLESGLRVGNFSSGHAFTFEDGTILPACHMTRVTLGKLETEEKVSGKWIGFRDVEIHDSMSNSCRGLVLAAQDAFTRLEVDVIIVPLRLLQVLRREGISEDFPFRTIRKIGRTTTLPNGEVKEAPCSCETFCK